MKTLVVMHLLCTFITTAEPGGNSSAKVDFFTFKDNYWWYHNATSTATSYNGDVLAMFGFHKMDTFAALLC